MKRIAFLITVLVFVATADLAPSWAQPASMTATPKTAMATTAPKPLAATDPMVTATTATTADPMAMAKPGEAPAPAMATTSASEPPAKSATETPKAVEPVPEWKTAAFWITKVALPILGVILALLVAFGVFKKTWLQWLKEKNAVEIADKVVTQFETYAKGTKANWDDILAQVLKAVVTRVGELTGDMEVQVRKVVEERKEQADKKNGNGDTTPA